MQKYDVAIIGAGPSGCITALLCAKAGLRVTLIEQKTFPRQKPCGGGLTSKTITILREIDCFSENIAEKYCRSIQIHLPKLDKTFFVEAEEPFLVTVERATFDAFLANRAAEVGVDLKEGERFLKFKIHSSGYIEVITERNTILAELLVGADGVFSKVRKQLELENPAFFPKRELLIGVTTDIPFEVLNPLCKDCVHLFFNFGVGIDYGWAFPKQSTFNVGFGYKLKRNFPVVIERVLKSFVPQVNEEQLSRLRISAGALPIFYNGQFPFIQWGHIILVGDAAGFVDEWTGEGLYYGVKSAVHAATAIKLYFTHHRKMNFLRNYSRLCLKDFYSNLFLPIFLPVFSEGVRPYITILRMLN